jgi:hypothetical protein
MRPSRRNSIVWFIRELKAPSAAQHPAQRNNSELRNHSILGPLRPALENGGFLPAKINPEHIYALCFSWRFELMSGINMSANIS